MCKVKEHINCWCVRPRKTFKTLRAKKNVLKYQNICWFRVLLHGPGLQLGKLPGMSKNGFSPNKHTFAFIYNTFESPDGLLPPVQGVHEKGSQPVGAANNLQKHCFPIFYFLKIIKLTLRSAPLRPNRVRLGGGRRRLRKGGA